MAKSYFTVVAIGIVIALVLLAGCTDDRTKCNDCNNGIKSSVISFYSNPYPFVIYTNHMVDEDGIDYGVNLFNEFEKVNGHNITFRYKCFEGGYVAVDVIRDNDCNCCYCDKHTDCCECDK
jgi:hypothetical protein